ncbi:unnamed protein product [Rodentolepis nana]|uniref:Adenosine 3'-phospho 5'-phosphosulfate transporter 1 n=1 Tax=Rodentolepis nana TaxID=102285 RepID=A0A0R3TR05_RODNA|nr:unnamed protein product [Rodentolepis nana]
MATNEVCIKISFFDSSIRKIKPLGFCLLLLAYTICAILIQVRVYSSIQLLLTPDLWFLRLTTIILCYALLYLPIAVLKRISPLLVQQWEAETSSLMSISRRFLVICFLNHLPTHRPLLDPPSSTSKSLPTAQAFYGLSLSIKQHKWIALVGCTLGLNFVYIMWGVLQEKIMTRSYNGEHFREPQFLIFCNRIGGLLVSVISLALIGKRGDDSTVEVKSPLANYASLALSNIVSSWCQYEALLFITFPVQVISKCCKAIPVMLMGRCLYGRAYKAYEYITTALISLGVCMFILSSPSEHSDKVTENSISGLILICGYVALDSFTSTSQANLFRTFKMSPLHMMSGVCSWAVLFTITPLLADGSLKSSCQFAWRQPEFAFDAVASALCSGFGQILIFATIAEFGAVTFSLIMTVRMCLSILVSCILFSHPLNVLGVGGLLITFGAIIAKMIYQRIVSTASAPIPKS